MPGDPDDVCASYDWEIGTLPQIEAPKPDWSDRNGDTIMLDACIAATVLALWDRGHRTLSSCCGHGRDIPSLVLDQGNVNFPEIRRVIAEVDGREVRLYQWQLWEV